MEFSRVETFCKGPGGHFRRYMAPEKLVGSWTTEKSHVWSLGCIVSEMFLGFPLYSGYSDYEIIWKLTQNHGRFPDHLLNGGHKTREFYFKSQTNHWLLKTPREYGKKVLDVKLVSPDDFRSQQKLGFLSKMGQKQLEHFIDLVKGMLQLDPEKRIPLLQLLRHPFIAGNMDPPRISIGNFKQNNEDTQCAPHVHRGLKRKIIADTDLVVNVSVGKKRRICVEDIPTNVHSSEASQPSPKRINPDLKRKLVSETESDSSLPAPKKKRICEEDIPKNPQSHPGDERGPNDKKPLLKRQRSSEDLMPPPKKIKLICDNVPPSSAPVSKAKLDFKSCPSTSTTIQPEKFEEDTSGSPDISFALDSSPTVQTSEVTREPDVSMNGSSTSSGAQLPADDSCGEDLHLKANVQQTDTAEDDLDSLLRYFEDDSL
ncbi:mitogen-activated protein kinase 9 [Oryzias melastigma]|uniref:mitogen-activated protein kinase 9 n=1 Tax=Oryzias melastigma TaxID=30732 RepID=UPI000CF82E43|nr:mitogen-activated protein kinase 9 [Oryzias melastigma]